MSNQTNEIWEGFYEENHKTILGCIGWLFVLTFIIIRLASKFLTTVSSKCWKSFRYLGKLTLKFFKFLDNCCTLVVDDVDTIYPTITFKEEPKGTKSLMEQWFNWGIPQKDVKVEPIKRKVEKVMRERPTENIHPWDIAQEIITE